MMRIQREQTLHSQVSGWFRKSLSLSLAGVSTLTWVLASPLPASTQSSPTCSNSSVAPFPRLTNHLVKATSWVGEVAIGTELLLATLAPQLAAYLSPSPWPNLHERAKLARVPIIMYHDILPQKEVFFDVTPEEFEAQLKLIQESGATPISLHQLVIHLRTGVPLPDKPILLTFDDGYSGHYEYVYPLLKKYGYPGTFAIYPNKVGKKLGRSSLTWEQLRQMAADPLVTITSHSVTHPADLRTLSDTQLRSEVMESKQILETELGIPINYFTYPTGYYDERVTKLVTEAGYQAALTMDDANERFAGQSDSLLAIGRFGQSRLQDVLPQAWGGPKLPKWWQGFDFTAPIELAKTTIDSIPLVLISGGKPTTIHAKSRYQVQEIIANTGAEAAVDGGFFSLEFLDSNVMIGPVFSKGQFVPGNASENPRLTGRPLVLIGPRSVRFVPFDPKLHNTLEGVQAEMANVTDAFVAAAWLVKGGQPQPEKAFGNLFDFNAARHRAFWGINQAGQPTIGVSEEPVGSVDLGAILEKAGFRDAVMLDSGASTSLAYKGESMVGYVPRPVPHVVALVPPQLVTSATCTVATR